MKNRLSSNLLFGLAAVSFLAMPVLAQDSTAAEKGPVVKFSGEVEFDAYTGDVLNDDKQSHSYASTFDLNVDVQFNEKWSAYVGLEADGETTDPTAIYNGAYIQYTRDEKTAVKFGDLTFSEGAFLNYYGYDDPADNAAGMTEHDIRGVEVDYSGLIVGLGYASGDNDYQICVGEEGEEVCSNVAYDAHVAYELGLGDYVIRPYVDYKSYQEAKHNELHAGVDANLKFGAVGLHAVYGLHADYLGEDSPKATHAFLAEPSLALGGVNVKGTIFYAYFDEDDPTVHGTEIPEYFFAYAEPSMSVLEVLTLGIPLEYHTNTLNKNDDVSTFDLGVRAYFTPVAGIDVTGFAMVDVPVGDYAGDDTGLTLGVESVFSF